MSAVRPPPVHVGGGKARRRRQAGVGVRVPQRRRQKRHLQEVGGALLRPLGRDLSGLDVHAQLGLPDAASGVLDGLVLAEGGCGEPPDAGKLGVVIGAADGEQQTGVIRAVDDQGDGALDRHG